MAGTGRKLGRRTPALLAHHNPRALQLADYLREGLPPPPPSDDWTGGIRDWGVMRNDVLGCCTVSALGHAIQGWTKCAQGEEITVPDAAIERAYQASGYVPGDPASDQGWYESDALAYAERVGIGGRKILGHVAVDPRNRLHVDQGIHYFGGLYLGLALPRSCEAQRIWDVTDPLLRGEAAPGSLGGHATWGVARNAPGLVPGIEEGYVQVSWGELVGMTADFAAAYVEECHAVVSADWISRETHLAPVGLRLEELTRDLAQVAIAGARRGTGPIDPGLAALLSEIGTAFAPVVAEFLSGGLTPAVYEQALGAAVAVASHHLLQVDGFALLATMQKLAAWPKQIVDFLLAHPLAEPLHPERRDEPGMGVDGNPVS
jgi:hypothetical protein